VYQLQQGNGDILCLNSETQYTESLNEMFSIIFPKNYKHNNSTNTTTFEIYGKIELDFENSVCRIEIKEFDGIFCDLCKGVLE
jgi:hypothetical protein